MDREKEIAKSPTPFIDEFCSVEMSDGEREAFEKTKANKIIKKKCS